MIYLDHNATTPPWPAVIDRMGEALAEQWGNPSSPHRAGQVARRALDRARASVAALIHARASAIVFGSGGTEAINQAVRSAADAAGAVHSARAAARATAGTAAPAAPGAGPITMLAPATEHVAVREALARLQRTSSDRAITVESMALDDDGIVDVRALSDRLARDPVHAVVVGWVHSETGVVQPIESIGRLVRAHGALVVVDGVQRVGREPIDIAALPIDLLAMSAHKLGGPKGVGALWVRDGLPVTPIVAGGPHELERRGGTENVPGIVGFGAAAREVTDRWLDPDSVAARLDRRDRFEAALAAHVPGIRIHGRGAPRSWAATSVALPEPEAELAVMMLSEAGICVSAGSACSSGSIEPSAALLAMGVPERIARRTIRISAGYTTTDEELDAAASAIAAIVRQNAAASEPH